MSEDIGDVTVAYEEDGQEIVEELDKVVLSKGAWSSILFRYRQRDPKTGEMGPPKATLRRYQKYNGVYKKRDAVNLTAETARKLVETLGRWLEEGQLGESDV